MENKQVAMLMDFENLVIGLENNDPESKKSFSAKTVIDFIEKNYGRVIFRKAFADWSNPKFRKYTQDMMRCGIEMQHIHRSGYNNNKNYAESLMVIQAMDCMARNPEISTFILITGDADFLPLISYIKSTGRTAIGLGTEGTVSGALLANCDEFIFYGNDGLHNGRQAAIDRGPVIKALKNIIGTAGAYVNDIDEELADEMPDFNPADMGYEDLYAFLESMPSLVRLDNAGDEPKAFWIFQQAPKPQQRFNNKVELPPQEVSNMPLDEYMKATRWFIQDGQMRVDILTNIYNILSEPGTVISSDDLRQEASSDYMVEDKPWQGTIFSLVCGSCLWEKPESADLPLHMRKLSLFKNVRSLDDFMIGYYTSLFHKAFMEREDLNAQTMTELMHPEDVDGHLPLFEKVYSEMSDKR